MLWRAKSGDTSRSTASMASPVSAPASTKKTLETRSSARPLFSSASMVLAKLGGCGIGGDGVDLGAVRRQRPVEGGAEMLRLDVGERRQAERAGPVGKQRVFGSGLRIGHDVHLAMNARLVTPSAPAAR